LLNHLLEIISTVELSDKYNILNAPCIWVIYGSGLPLALALRAA
jgi:hypothetical protein